MKTLELEGLGMVELKPSEREMIEGGNPFWIAVGIGVGVMAVYDFTCGVYTGIKEELAKA